MKKKFLFAVLIMLTAGSTFYASYVNDKQTEAVSEIVLANVEALSRAELPEITIECGKNGGICWIRSGFCLRGEYTLYDCEFLGYTTISCTSDC